MGDALSVLRGKHTMTLRRPSGESDVLVEAFEGICHGSVRREGDKLYWHCHECDERSPALFMNEYYALQYNNGLDFRAHALEVERRLNERLLRSGKAIVSTGRTPVLS